MFLRNSSAESIISDKNRKTSRKSSMVEWVNGLTDNNDRTDTWGRSIPSSLRRTRFGSIVSVDEPEPDEITNHKAQMIVRLKREVKNIMEEAVSKRNLDIGSTYVTSLCVAVEACLMDGLRKRLLGLFGCRSSLALLHTISKNCASAEKVLQTTLESHSRMPTSHHLTWIRESLHMRTLHDILVHVATSPNVRRLYEPSALMMDKSKGGMVAALLLGPCAVTFRKMATERNEPTAEDLVERQQTCPASSTKPIRPPLTIQRQSSSIVSNERGSVSRDYVYSLHHNFKSSLLYGKNNVCLAGKEDCQPVKGYLSLHKSYEGNLSLKWTPNQLMHASSQPSSASIKDNEQQWLWKQAIHIDMMDIIYIHLHQRDDCSPSILSLIDCEGVQSPPLQLPAGQNSLIFMTCLENGLAPTLRLDPPLWVGGVEKEKMLPRLRKRSNAAGNFAMLDLVFRIVRVSGTEHINNDYEQNEEESTCVSLPASPYITSNVDSLLNLQLDKACQSVRQQILARAFHGWLSYCRHLRTIRKHLLYLVNTKEMTKEERSPVDDAFWKRCRTEKTTELEDEFLQRVFWKGIDGSNSKDLRRQTWPYLLRLFDWSEGPEPKTSNFTKKYREDVEEWRILEAEVRRRDEEAFLAARSKKVASPVREESIASEVFEEETQVFSSFEETAASTSEELLHQFATNLHRIDKDVERCDRNLIFFSNKENLESLRRVMCTYVRRNLDEGYIQGMCDILAPILVIFEDEALSLECFTIIMFRLRDNFPQKTGMDQCLSNLRSLIQVVDPQIYSMLTSTSDFTHLYFSYRWFLLDFKRELSYDSTYRVWETIWAASRTFTTNFSLFFALAMITNYREVIINNNMDFTDLIKFFNEMAERHDCNRLLDAARGHVISLQSLVQQLK